MRRVRSACPLLCWPSFSSVPGSTSFRPGLALATDLVRERDQPRVVGLMYVMLLIGMVLSALV